MSQEPPRVIFPGTNAPNANSARQTNSRPRGSARRVVAFALGTLFLLVFLCGGGLFLTYRKYNADSNFGGKFTDLREPISGTIPTKTRDAIQRAVASDSDEAEEVTNWLQDDFPEVDKPRMVMEMQRSGLSNAAINPLTRSVWSFNLDEAMEPPNLGDRVAVLDFEWTVKDKEARAVVATFTSYNDNSSVYVLYLSRRSGQWKLFDWRDVLQPMSEAQYWAIYAGTREPQNDAHLDFANNSYEIYSSGAPTSDRIKRTVAAYNKTKFPRRFSVMAQDTLCEWLVVYKAKQELAEYAKQLNANDFAGAWLYKARSAAWADDTELAFQHLDALNKQIGWHPETGRLAAEIAKTPEQKRLAAEWLEREIQLAPVNSTILHKFFEIADRQQTSALFQGIAKSKDPDAAAIELIESLYYLKERQTQYLVDMLQPIAELPQTKQYLEFKLAVEQDDFGKVMDLAPKVLKIEALAVTENSPFSSSLWHAYLNAAVKTNALARAFEETPDRDELLSQLQDFAIYNSEGLPLNEVLAILKSLPVDHELNENKETQIAIGSLEIEQGNASQAFDLMLAIYKENESQIESEESSPFTSSLLRIMGKSALKSERWRELTEVLSAEELLLLLGGSSEINSNQLNQVLEWYDGLENQPACWSKYFRARMAFENGDWPTADSLMEQAIQLVKKDERFNEDIYSTLLGVLINFQDGLGFDPYESDLPEYWVGLRMFYAVRCNSLDRLVAQAQLAEQMDETWIGKIGEYYSQASIESQEKIVSLLESSQVEQAQTLAGNIRSHLLILRGQFSEAFDDQIKQAREMERDSYEQRAALTAAGKQLLMSGDRSRSESLKQASRGTEMEAYADCVSATLERDITALSKAMKRWKDIEWNYQKFVNVNVLNRLRVLPNLREVFDAQPLDVEEFIGSDDMYVFVLSETPEEAAKAFENYLKANALNHRILDVSRFEHATAAIDLQTADGDYVFKFEPTSEKAFITNEQTESIAKDARTIVMCIPKYMDLGQYEARRIVERTQLNRILGGLPSAIALNDSGSLSLFYGDGWRARFGQSLQTGIDPAHPQECYGVLVPKTEQRLFVERNGQSYIAFGKARELIPVKLQAETSPWLDELGVTLAPSILVPYLPAEAVVKIER